MYIQEDDLFFTIFGKIAKPLFKGIWYLITLPYQLHKRKKKAEASKAAQELITNPPIPQALLSPAPHGVILGKRDNHCVIKPEDLDGHILAVGGAGSGKSSCIAIPSLRGWNARVFAIDIKGELYQTTKEHRPNIMLFNPLDEAAHGYDPFYFLNHTNNPVQEARMIAQTIIPLPPDVKDPFWIESAQNIFTGAILHYYSQGLSFIESIQEIQNTPPIDLIEIIFENGTPEAKAHVSPFIGMDNKTLYGITAELSRHIVSFATNKDLISCFSRKQTITPAHLERGADIYIQIPEHLLEQWRPLLTLIVNQFLSFFERRSEQNTTPILFLLDEFPRLGKIPAILNGLATLRSKKITICLLIQSLAQLDLIYGKNSRKVISDNCAYKAVFNATDADTQEYFSKLVGTFGKIKTTESEHRKPIVPVTQGSSTSTTTEDKRIIRPEEFATLSDIVLLTPFGFCRANKAPYYAVGGDSETVSPHNVNTMTVKKKSKKGLIAALCVVMIFIGTIAFLITYETSVKNQVNEHLSGVYYYEKSTSSFYSDESNKNWYIEIKADGTYIWSRSSVEQGTYAVRGNTIKFTHRKRGLKYIYRGIIENDTIKDGSERYKKKLYQ